MAHKSQDFESLTGLKQQIKALKSKCKETCLTIANNSPTELQDINLNNQNEKSLCYMDGIRAEIEGTDTIINVDENLIALEFENELKARIVEVKQLIAYKEAAIHENNEESARLQNLIKSSKEVKSMSNTNREVRPEHLQRANERFKLLKTSLADILNALFPDFAEDMKLLIGSLINEKSNESSDGYIKITSEHFHLVESLVDMEIIACNPYDKKQIKLNF